MKMNADFARQIYKCRTNLAADEVVGPLIRQACMHNRNYVYLNVNETLRKFMNVLGYISAPINDLKRDFIQLLSDNGYEVDEIGGGVNEQLRIRW